MIPVDPPRALQVLTELDLEVGKDGSKFLHRPFPRLFLSDQVHGEQRTHLLPEGPVPLPEPAVLIGEDPRDGLQLTDVFLQRRGVVPGYDLPEPVPRVGEHLLKLNRVVEHHRLLARNHLRGDVVVKVGNLPQDHAVPVELPRGLSLGGDVPANREPQRRELPHLPQ